MATAKAKTTETEALAIRESADMIAAIKTTQANLKAMIDAGDMAVPSIAICQSMSPQRKRDNEALYIEGIEEGDLFNTLSRENYGRVALELTIVRIDKGAREFEKDAAGKRTKKLIDGNVPWDDPRCFPTVGPGGVKIPARADRFYRFIAYLPAQRDVVAIRFERSKMPGAKTLNYFFAKRPSWTFSIAPAREVKDGNDYYIFRVDYGKEMPLELLQLTNELHETFKVAPFTVHEVGQDEAESGTIDTDKVPF